MKDLRLSVVIPTYNKAELLARTLGALVGAGKALTTGAFEVVVVDDGSSDSTPEVLDHFSERLPLVRAGGGRNEGRARARNRGWHTARGRFVLFLDDDIILDPGAMTAHLAAQEEHPAVWLGDVITDPEIVDSDLFAYLDSRGVAKHPPGSRVPARYLLTQNVSLPRTALEWVGGFDEEFGTYGFEDMEIAFRLEDRAQMEFFHLGGARGLHAHHHHLGEYLEKKRLCGRKTLPQIARLHPGRVREMQLDLLKGIEPAPTEASRRFLRLAIHLAGEFRIGALLEFWSSHGGALPARAYDFLVMNAYREGLCQNAVNMAGSAQ